VSWDGPLWITLPDKPNLYQLKNGALQNFALPWLEEDTLKCCWEDREKNLWLGTSLSGLVRMQPLRIRTFSRHDGLPFNDTWSACESKDGSIWVGSEYQLARIKDDRAVPFALNETSGGKIMCLLEDREGALWVGQEGSVDVTLKLGQVTEQFKVTADAPVVSVTAADISGVVGERVARRSV